MDSQQFEQLVREHASALELFASQWTDAPQDCVQDAFLQLVRQKQPPERIVPWLYRVTRNRAISLARQAQRRKRREADTAHERQPWFLDSAMSEVTAEEATRALESLPEQYREVVVARIWGALSFEEIAEVIGASSSSAHRRYETGLKMLRDQLGVVCTANKNRETN